MSHDNTHDHDYRTAGTGEANASRARPRAGLKRSLGVKAQSWQMPAQSGGDIIAPASAGAPDTGSRHTTFHVVDLDCPECAKKVHTAASRAPGVISADLLFSSAKLIVEHTGEAEDIVRAVARVGHKIEPLIEDREKDTRPFLVRNRRALLTAISGVLIVLAYAANSLFGGNETTSIVLFGIASLVGGYMPAVAGLRAAWSGFSFDMNFLMVLAVTGAAIIGEWSEAATVVFLFSLGNALEAYTLEKTRSSIELLVGRAPKIATVRRRGKEADVQVSDLRIGDTVLVRPGSSIPADGTVSSGESEVNQAPITGESVPVWKTKGSEVFAGTINGSGYLEVSVERRSSDSTIARIVRLVTEAQSKKSPVERFVDRFARYYTPSVIALAVGIAVVPPLYLRQPLEPWFYRALSLLVVSCPCALVISTPVSVTSAIASAARHGVLVKGGAYIEQAGSLTAMAFDKTGTITMGKPEVTDVLSYGGTEDLVLALAAGVEQRSEHPFAQAIVAESGRRSLKPEKVESFASLAGKGARALTSRGEVQVIRPEAVPQIVAAHKRAAADINSLREQGKTASIVLVENEIAGVIAVADAIRPGVRQVTDALHALGVKHLVMLTGDNEKSAAHVALQAGIDRVFSGLLPEEKVENLKNLRKSGKVAMVGDGINDAPALAQADIGIAMGAAGTDVALETADIALMGDDLSRLPFAIDLSRKTMGIIRQNIAFSLFVKLLAVLLVFPGLLTLWMAILADTGAALIVILNGMRLLRARPS